MQNNDNELKPVEPENYELQPIDNTQEELPQEELDNVNFFDVLDNYNEQPSEDKTVINESMANTQPLTEDKFEPAPEAPYADNVAQIKQPSTPQIQTPMADLMGERQKQIGSFIDAYKNSLQKGDEQEAESLIEENPEIADEALPENTESKEEAEQITDDTDNRNDEVNNEEIKKDIKAEQQGLIDWDKVKVYEPGEDATGYGIEKESFDPRVEENLNYDYDQNIPQDNTFETSITDTTQDFSPEIGELSDVVDYGLEDQNQYGADLPSEDETIIDEKMANTEPLSDDNFEPAPEAPYADNVVQLKQQKEQLDKELEEAKAEPVTDKESAIRKQNRVKMARAAIANFNASNPSFNNQIQQSNGSVSTGGRVSPSAGIGNIGGGASGHGAMSPVNSRRADNAINAGRVSAGGGSMPVTLGSGSSKVIQPSRSFSNGSLSSGSFGLMSKNKGNGAFSSKPVSLPNGESSSVVGGVNVDSIAESGKNALVERLKTLLDKLSPEQRKQLGFSPKGYSYQGERFEDLDGYTIQKLLEEVEKLVGSF